MINFFKAISIILNTTKNKHIFLKKKNISIKNALNKVSDSNIFSYKNTPFFKNSAMDGYTIKNNDIKKINIKKEIFFKIVEKIKAGDFAEKKVNDLEAIEIMTGARLPSDFNIVIKYEDTLKKNNGFVLNKNIKKFENVKLIGEDIKIGDKIINNGKIISAEEIMVLASIGINFINVYKNPNIFLANTGNEIVEKNKKKLTSIPNSSKYYILSLLKFLKINANNIKSIEDNKKKFINFIKKIWYINELSIFLTTGAVSKGKYDFIPKLLKNIGVKIHFHGVNIKPGKPILFSQFKNFIYFFCLPGNPISTFIGFRFFFLTLLRNITGQNLEEPILIKSKKKNLQKDTFLKSYSLFSKGNIKNKILKEQESFKVKPLLKANSFTFIKKQKKNQYIYLNKI